MNQTGRADWALFHANQYQYAPTMPGVSTPRQPRSNAGGIFSLGFREQMKTVVVTGANRGIGLAAARNLAGRGYDLVLVCRDEKRGQAALESLHSPQSSGNHRLVLADLASLDSVRAAALQIVETNVPVSALVNNAACLPVRRTKSRDGFELQLAVNHLAHFLLTILLLPRLRLAAGPSRIVTVSSAAHSGPPFNFRDPNFERRRYRRRRAYQQSKLANILFTRALARRISGTGVQAVALHPGVYDTGLLHDYIGRMPGARTFRRLGANRADRAGPIVAELAVGKREEDLNGRYFDKGVLALPVRVARDMKTQERLWEWSAAAVGLEPEAFGEVNGGTLSRGERAGPGGGKDTNPAGTPELPLR